jgi:hypothetical protein
MQLLTTAPEPLTDRESEISLQEQLGLERDPGYIQLIDTEPVAHILAAPTGN